MRHVNRHSKNITSGDLISCAHIRLSRREIMLIWRRSGRSRDRIRVDRRTCLADRLPYDEASGFSFMQSWLNWYSIGPENRHSERALHAGGMCSAPTEPGGETSGFGLRSAPVGAKPRSTGPRAPHLPPNSSCFLFMHNRNDCVMIYQNVCLHLGRWKWDFFLPLLPL